METRTTKNSDEHVQIESHAFHMYERMRSLASISEGLHLGDKKEEGGSAQENRQAVGRKGYPIGYPMPEQGKIPLKEEGKIRYFLK